MACSVRILRLFRAICNMHVGKCILYSNTFWFWHIKLLTGRKQGAVSCLNRSDESDWAPQVTAEQRGRHY